LPAQLPYDREFLSLRPVGGLPGHCELLIQSQWLGAKNPSGLQVKHRAIVGVSALEGLRDMIWKALSD
jgi:hypothetical protein